MEREKAGAEDKDNSQFIFCQLPSSCMLQKSEEERGIFNAFFQITTFHVEVMNK